MNNKIEVTINDESLTRPIARIKRDMKVASLSISTNEIRYLVDTYYNMQEERKSMNLRSIALGKQGSPHSAVDFYMNSFYSIEDNIKSQLSYLLENSKNPVLVWLKSVKGIGPIIATGLYAEIDISKAPTAGSIWRFAGQDPSVKWLKGNRRPWNADLKRICYYAGESFVKSGNFYRKIYDDRRRFAEEKNRAGGYADLAQKYLDHYKWGEKTRPAVFAKHGFLADSAIHGMTKRYVVKLFLSHLHQIWREAENLSVPRPYAIEHLGHAHIIPPVMDDRKEIYAYTKEEREEFRKESRQKDKEVFKFWKFSETSDEDMDEEVDSDNFGPLI